MLTHALQAVLQRLHNAARDAGRPTPALLAVSKLQPAAAIAALAAAGQHAFGENYVQEAQGKQAELAADLSACRKRLRQPHTAFTMYTVAQVWGRKVH